MNISTTLSMPVGMLLTLDQIARAKNTTRSALVQRYIKEGLQKDQNEKSK